MGIRVLGVRKTRAIERLIDRPVLRAWGGGHASLFGFATVDHVHGQVDMRTGAIEWGGRCPVSCARLFGGTCPGCGHEDHRGLPCTRRVRTEHYGVCYHREDPCPDPALHVSEDQATRPCRCAEPRPDDEDV